MVIFIFLIYYSDQNLVLDQDKKIHGSKEIYKASIDLFP